MARLILSSFVLLAVTQLALALDASPLGNYARVCSQIARIVAPSPVYYPGSPNFQWLSSHWSGSSSQLSACVVEPRSASDVSKILAQHEPHLPGGHTANPGFSSTKGVHISLNSLRSIRYDRFSKTVEFGTGVIWDDVYAALEPYGVSVVGGRNTGVGVGGFTLGGGYSWKTNQLGLTIDTVTAFELVKPNGDVVTVTERSDPKLFFALKGSQNNFGIVTKITLKTFPQGPVWGGMITYVGDEPIAAARAATAKFANGVSDPKASIINSFILSQGTPLVVLQLYYDGPRPPAGIFKDFLDIPAAATDVSTRSYISFVQSVPVNASYGVRGYFEAIPVTKYTPKFLDLVSNTLASTSAEFANTSYLSTSVAIEPFLPTIYSHNTTPSAYPFDRSKVFQPCNLAMSWTNPAEDKIFEQGIKKVRDTLYAGLIEEGQTETRTAPLYSNNAIWDTSFTRIYGSNLPVLKTLKAQVDPSNVMGLAGGFKIPI
ncbi:hypothetical protein EST38_g11933 [Candolleomyces aberdarensis]|uniref:FAD-binding PCMH-type domain-containing protein n=1 Tax=Candolleomyces aberdarensis TaxID=2316362 RepID=A0A4Q2D5Z0_9AGAR|nr:hypothetical protein EST38_g11933 [Candolleomyces aberdarensis]